MAGVCETSKAGTSLTETIIIIGGGIVGYATALHLKLADPQLDVVILERDLTYATAATGKGTGGIRQLFTRPENIALSQYTLEIVHTWDEWASEDGRPAPDLQWQPNGYLFIAGTEDIDSLRANYQTQSDCGVEAVWFEPQDLEAKYPEIRTTDLRGAVLSPDDGWLDPWAFFDGVRRKAHVLGVRVEAAEVTQLRTRGDRVTGVDLADGRELSAGFVVNAGGTRAPHIAAQLDIVLPVEPMRRHEHYAIADHSLNHLPFIKDIAGLAIHAHAGGVSVGLVDFNHPGGEDFTIDPHYYATVVQPALEYRLPAAGRFAEQRTWTGLYDQNRFDGNAIIGNAPGQFENFYFAAGFSGHGFMHALGVGRGLTEHILTGEYWSIDLENLGYQRILDGRPYPELGIR